MEFIAFLLLLRLMVCLWCVLIAHRTCKQLQQKNDDDGLILYEIYLNFMRDVGPFTFAVMNSMKISILFCRKAVFYLLNRLCIVCSLV